MAHGRYAYTDLMNRAEEKIKMLCVDALIVERKLREAEGTAVAWS